MFHSSLAWLKCRSGASKSGAMCLTVPRRLPSFQAVGAVAAGSKRATDMFSPIMKISSPGLSLWINSGSLAFASFIDIAVMAHFLLIDPQSFCN